MIMMVMMLNIKNGNATRNLRVILRRAGHEMSKTVPNKRAAEKGAGDTMAEYLPFIQMNFLVNFSAMHSARSFSSWSWQLMEVQV